ncbi:hypothetical protein [Streptomyces sp. SAS_272]|uniref:hypothetical protein n=1 Tax=Streptomyces sp. SAS_272 TaxID=3412747 RepID=UPI00403C453F
MCEHQNSNRFDPGQCSGACPACGTYGSAEPGQPVAMHQKPGSRETCPGSGQPAV